MMFHKAVAVILVSSRCTRNNSLEGRTVLNLGFRFKEDITMTQFTNMTLDDLKTGMIVTLRKGVQYAVMRNTAAEKPEHKNVFVYTNFDQSKVLSFYDGGCGFMTFDRYNSNLTHVYDSKWDIVKVEIPKHAYGFMDLTYRVEDRKVIWIEPTAVKLTVAEIENRLGYKIEIVSEEE